MDNKASQHTRLRGENGSRLDHKTIGRLTGRFLVPEYQRGYRWEREDVRRLLDDIWEQQGRPYSLQPVVVKPCPAEDGAHGDIWEVIDGQQRLTTLYLIFHFIRQQGWKRNGAPFSLRYVTREDTQRHLEHIGADPARDAQDSTKSIDAFHVHQAYREIADWFAGHGEQDHLQEHAAGKLNSYLYDAVRVIWYEVPDSTNVTALFTRLNVGRIPLTDAELVKAALLSRLKDLGIDRAHEIAAQWDGIERDLHRQEIWAFIAGSAGTTNDDRYPTRISLLLDTLADLGHAPPAGPRPRYHSFHALKNMVETDPVSFWQRVVALHAQILGWYEEPRSFNKIGFLVTVAENGAAELARNVREANGKKKSELDAHLTGRIKQALAITREEIEDLRYEDRNRGYRKLVQLLLLMNVETASRAARRFPFAEHVGHHWSLEHIHAQNAEALNKAEQWKAWLRAHTDAIGAVRTPQNEAAITAIKSDVSGALAALSDTNAQGFAGADFAVLSHRILTLLNRDDAIDHSIGNMALLSQEDNSHLSNAVFEVKRQRILERDRQGRYVPACTRNVFLKYYSGADAQQPHFWSEKDKESYLAEIHSLLQPYYLASARTEQA